MTAALPESYPLQPSTARQRRSREGRRAGDVHVAFYVYADGIGVLETLGWLPSGERRHDAVVGALLALAQKAAAMDIRP